MSIAVDGRSDSRQRWRIDGVDFDVAAVWGLTIARGHFDRMAGLYEVARCT